MSVAPMAHRLCDPMSIGSAFSVRYRTQLMGVEDLVRREALVRYLKGDEEGALDLLAAARAMAGEA